MPEVLTQLKTWILQGFGFALAFDVLAYFKRSCALRYAVSCSRLSTATPNTTTS